MTAADRRLRLTLTSLGIAILLATAVGLFTSARGPFPFAIFMVGPFVVTIAFLVAGWIGWERRPDSRIGMLLQIAGVVYAAGQMIPVDWSPLFTVAWLVGSFYTNVLGHMLLAFPTGRLQTRGERALVVAFYATGLVGIPFVAMFSDPRTVCTCLPRNVALLADAPRFVDAMDTSTSAISVVWAVLFILVMIRHWRGAAPTTRRALAVVYWGGAVGGATELARELGDALGTSFQTSIGWAWVNTIVLVALPLAFLVGLLRLRMTRGAVGDLVVQLGSDAELHEGLRDALARRLGDPTLQLSYRLPDGSWVDDAGRPVERPSEQPGRSLRVLETEGEPFAALALDARLDDVPELVSAVVAAARLAIANDRLRAEVRAQLEEVQASRRRIVEAADAARRRVERDLHDGAQQRLVGLSLGLRMLQDRLGDAEDLEAQIAGLQEELRTALSELRELARGLHPTILTEEGLGPAVESLAERSAVPVEVSVALDAGDGRFPPPVEATAYFVVAEALTNVAKYAHASHARVEVAREDGTLLLDVTDDGVGGARVGAGSGLSGLLDRVSALGGSLRVESAGEGGTRVHAEIPAG
ncbi:MAG: histidine kinase [Planctomycetaceae bacterium]